MAQTQIAQLVVNNVLATASFYFGGAASLIGLGTFGTALYTLQLLGPDGVTWMNTTLSITTVGITAAVSLPAGTYKLVLTSGTGNSAVYVNLAAVTTSLN